MSASHRPAIAPVQPRFDGLRPALSGSLAGKVAELAALGLLAGRAVELSLVAVAASVLVAAALALHAAGAPLTLASLGGAALVLALALGP